MIVMPLVLLRFFIRYYSLIKANGDLSPFCYFLILTSCEVNMTKYSGTVLTYGLSEMRSTQKAKVRIFSLQDEQLVNESFIV